MAKPVTAAEAREIVIQHLIEQVGNRVEQVDTPRPPPAFCFYTSEPFEDHWVFRLKGTGLMLGPSEYIAVSKKTGRFFDYSS